MSSRIEIKAALQVDDAGTISGIAWPFGSADRVGDIIEKGAFTAAPAAIPMLFAHDQAQAVGVWDAIEEKADGLHVSGRLLIEDVQRAREVRALAQAGAVTGLSIGFQINKAAPRKGGGRTISSLDLVECSIVAVPAHPGARITTAKAANQTGERPPMADDNTPDVLAEIDARVGAFESKFAARLDKIEARANRPAAGEVKADEKIEMKAFMSFVRRGIERMDAEEQKALTIADQGGAIAPAEFGSELIKLLRQFSPVRQYAKVITTGAGSIKYPKRVGSTAATWTGDVDDRTASDMSFDQVEIANHELATYVDVSNQLLEDNGYNLESELAQDLAESFAKAEGLAFVSGNGSGKPKGILAVSGLGQVTTGSAADLGEAPGDVLIGVFHALPQIFAQNGVWLMNRNTLATLRKVKTTTGEYLVTDLSTGAPATILGRPVVEMVDFPDVAANATPIIFGDLSGYRVVDRVAMQLLRDPFSMATKGQTRFHARRRVGADVTNPDRIIKLKVSA